MLEVEEAGSNYILSYVDLSTGEISVLNINKTFNALKSEIDNLECKELVVSDDFNGEKLTNSKAVSYMGSYLLFILL